MIKRFSAFFALLLLLSFEGPLAWSSCPGDFCKGERVKARNFSSLVKDFGLTHLMTFDSAIKGQPVGEIYVKLKSRHFDKFYIFLDWQDHLRDPKKFPTREDDDIDVENVLSVDDMKSSRTLMKMNGITVISSKFRQWLQGTEAGFVIDMTVLSEYNVVLSNDYSTRQIAFDVVIGQSGQGGDKGQAFYREGYCKMMPACKGVAFDYVWTRLRKGHVADYTGIRGMVFYDTTVSTTVPVAKTDL